MYVGACGGGDLVEISARRSMEILRLLAAKSHIRLDLIVMHSGFGGSDEQNSCYQGDGAKNMWYKVYIHDKKA